MHSAESFGDGARMESRVRSGISVERGGMKRRSDLSDATAGSKLDILPPESSLFSTNYFYLWLHDGYGMLGEGGEG